MRETATHIFHRSSSLRGPHHAALAAGAVVAATISVLSIGIFALSGPSQARSSLQTAVGRAEVIDGDTLSIGHQRIRLEGIDAPETSQTCPGRWFGTWACGKAATRALADLVEGHEVVCRSAGNDKYGRMLGQCEAAGRDINAEMVRSGYAWAFVKYSSTYVGQEAEARRMKLGIWQADAEPAWAFREKRWQSAESETPAGCAIKGNITNRGRIYHMPWSPWYAKVKIDASHGERWFCSESEALAAGWRPAAPG